MDLAKVSQDVQVYQEMLTSCEGAQLRSEVLKLITALVESRTALLQSRTALLQKEARLAGTAGGERLICCMMSRYLWHPHPLPALYGLTCWAKQYLAIRGAAPWCDEQTWPCVPASSRFVAVSLPLLRTEPVEEWATQALFSVQSQTSQQAAPGAKLREWDSPGQSPSTWGPLKGLGGLEEKQHALRDALGGHWGKGSKVLVFHFGLCLTLWLCALQVPTQIYPRGGCSCWCKLCRQLCLSCKSWNKPFSSPQLLSCQSQQL